MKKRGRHTKTGITAKEMRDRTYKKYLYPQIIDGITYENEEEKKLSESTWFRCLTPEKQIAVEREIRLRMHGAFNQQVLHFPDADMDCAPSISKPTAMRISESLTDFEMRLFFYMVSYIHTNDGLLRNKTNALLTMGDLTVLTGRKLYPIKVALHNLQRERVLLYATTKPEELRKIEGDFSDFSFGNEESKAEANQVDLHTQLAIYINPFIVFLEQYIDVFTLPFFKNSGWYAINPFSDSIEEWILRNCK